MSRRDDILTISLVPHFSPARKKKETRSCVLNHHMRHISDQRFAGSIFSEADLHLRDDGLVARFLHEQQNNFLFAMFVSEARNRK